MRGREAGTRPFVFTHRTHVAGTVRKLVHAKRILVHFYAVAGTVHTMQEQCTRCDIEN